MNWIFQSTGLIDRYRPKFMEGTQPIRVLNHMNIYMFQNTNPDFLEELQDGQIRKV